MPARRVVYKLDYMKGVTADEFAAAEELAARLGMKDGTAISARWSLGAPCCLSKYCLYLNKSV